MEGRIERKKIVIIGSGNVATMFGCHLAGKVDIVQVYSPTVAHARELAVKVGCENVACYPQDVVRDADMYIVAVKDDVLSGIARQFASYGGLWLHTSGTTPMSVFSGFGRYGVIYPLQTITKFKDVDMASVPLFIEACDEAGLDEVNRLSRLLGASDVRQCTSEQRMKLHIAAVFACNFVNCMMMHAQKLLHDAGTGLPAMAPLIRETIAKALVDDDLEKAQTGPARRGDSRIISRHLSQLTGEAHEIYKFISDIILSHYAKYE